MELTKLLEISGTDLKSLPESNFLPLRERLAGRILPEEKEMVSDIFFLYCTSQELCKHSSFDKQIHPRDRLVS